MENCPNKKIILNLPNIPFPKTLICFAFYRTYFFFGCLFNLAGCKTFKDNGTLFQREDVVAEGLFTSGIEGPSFHENGNIYLVNFQKEGTIGVLSPEHKVNELIQLPQGSVGNGIRVHPDGDLLVADYVGHNILKINILNKKIQIFAHNKDMNQPNDLAFHTNGFLYASDPNWKMSTGQLWLIRSDGATFCLEKIWELPMVLKLAQMESIFL